MIAELKANLAKPDADPVGAAAQFQRHFVALHPFGDSNGRTSRTLMNRILYELDMPPAIFADQNADMSLSPAQWREEVAKGVARSKAYLGQYNRNSKDEYVGKITSTTMAAPSPNKPITVDGLPFDLGADGFLYDPMGRPYMVQNDELIPMAQLDSKMLVILDDVAGSGSSLSIAMTNARNTGFKGEIVISPMVSTEAAPKLLQNGDSFHTPMDPTNTTFAPESMANALRGSDWYKSLPSDKQTRLEDLVQGLNFGSNGLTMAFPYMAPDNNNSFFSGTLAEQFVVNKNADGVKNHGKYQKP